MGKSKHLFLEEDATIGYVHVTSGQISVGNLTAQLKNPATWAPFMLHTAPTNTQTEKERMMQKLRKTQEEIQM